MRNIVAGVVLFALNVLTFTVYSKDVEVKYTLTWNENPSGNISLRGAVFFKETDSIPYFYKSHTIQGNYSSVSIQIVGFETENIDLHLRDDNILPNKIDVKKEFGKSGKSTVVNYWFPAVFKDMTSGNVKRIKSITLSIKFDGTLKSSVLVQKNISAKNSILTTGKWFKFEVIKPGVYMVTNNYLKKIGVDVSKSIRVFTGK